MFYLFVHPNVGEDQRLKLRLTLKIHILAFSIFFIYYYSTRWIFVLIGLISYDDTFLPITLALSTCLACWLYHALFIHHSGYSNLIRMCMCWVLFYFLTISDAKITQQNKCQRMMLSKLREKLDLRLSNSSHECTILSWSQIQNSQNHFLKQVLIYRWGITDSLRLFDQVRN